MNSYDLENRLIKFSIATIQLTGALPKTFSNLHLGKQLIRSSTSVALNYGEAQAGETRKDFVHKMKLCLKELRETYVCLKIIYGLQINKKVKIENELTECDELISIFVKSVKTAQNI